jgi:hypothetical protein
VNPANIIRQEVLEEAPSMRHAVLWTLLLLGLPVAASAGALAEAAPPALPDEESAIERAKTLGTAPPALDLRIDGAMDAAAVPFAPDEAPAPTLGTPLPSDLDRWLDPAQLPSPQGPPAGSQAAAGERTDRADRGLSFGLEVTPRSPIGALARQNRDQDQDPSLGGQLERLLERPAFGVRGRYRF